MGLYGNVLVLFLLYWGGGRVWQLANYICLKKHDNTHTVSYILPLVCNIINV